jgi:chromosomal replication initiation ATPase DnaA
MTVESVIRAIAADYGVEPHLLFEPRIYGRVVKARNLAMFVMRFHIGMSDTEIGTFFHRTHTTVSEATNRIMYFLDKGSDEAVRLKRILKSLEN